jgi:RNA polymerase sigma-70 factor (ECF subfamily)
MGARDTDLGIGEFPTRTHWTLVRQAGAEDGVSRRIALEELLRRYRPALKKFLVLGRRVQEEEAEELLQEFLVGKVLEKQLIGRAHESKGRFRDFIVTALKRFHIDKIRHAARLKKKESPMAEGFDPPAGGEEPDAVLDVAWARQVIAQAIERMKQECLAKSRTDIWGVFESQVLSPLLHDGPSESYGQLVSRLGLESPGKAHAVLATGKRMFKRNLHEVIGEYELSEQDVEGEIADLRQILGGAGAR